MIRNKSVEIEITKEEREEVKSFVEARLGENQSLYAKRGGFKEEDLWVGALAEVAAYKYLTSKGVESTPPDFKIYVKRKKSFDADISSNVLKFHVKGQSLRSSSLYGDSWLLQRHDKIVKEAHDNHYLILCNVNIEESTVKILGVVLSSSLHKKNCWGECKQPMFRTTKVAIYLKTLYDNLSNKQMWGI